MRLVEEMTYTETLDGPWGPIGDSPGGDRLVWQVATASLTGSRIAADLVGGGLDWLRLGADGVRRQDLRVSLRTGDGAVVLMRYDVGVIRDTAEFRAALAAGTATAFDDQYMRISPVFDTGDPRYGWLLDAVWIGEGRLAGPRAIEYRVLRVE